MNDSALGAQLSIIWRTGQALIQPEAGALLHYCEAAARVFAGVSGALVISLAVHADWIAGIFRSGSHAGMFLVAIVAGVSERLVLSFVSNVETSITSAGPGAKGSSG